MWCVVAKEEAFVIHSFERWNLEGKSKRQDHLARTIARIFDKVQIYINSKHLIRENQVLFCLSVFNRDWVIELMHY